MTNKRLSDVIRATDAHGLPIAKSASVTLEEKLIAFVKDYTVPRPDTLKRAENDTRRQISIDISYLRAENRRQKDRIKRLEYEIRDQINLMERAIEGHRETYDQVKRRISRLKGSLAYPGHS